jgi:rSAM-associated Gly-rich repeat protein
MKNANAGLLGFLLALSALATTPRAEAATDTAPGGNTIDDRLSRLTDAMRESESTLQVMPTTDPVYLAQGVFVNAAPSFRNHVGGWVNRAPGWINAGAFGNSGIHFLNNGGGFRNYYEGWPNRVNGWRNGGGSGWANAGGFRNGGGFYNGGFFNGGFHNAGFHNGGFRNGGGFGNGGFRNS